MTLTPRDHDPEIPEGIPAPYGADFRHYSGDEVVRRYRRASAGQGIDYLLRTIYGPLFLEVARAAMADTEAKRLRILDFGCGAGMAVHFLTEQLGREALDVELAVGADFVPAMISAAEQDVREYATPWARERLRFVVASNENLVSDIARGLDTTTEDLAESFQLAIGVNTFRYAIRHGTAERTVQELTQLLVPGGRVVVIDMNDRFPYWLRKGRPPRSDRPVAERLPTLEEYAQPFAAAGYAIERRERCCWVPHSAKRARFWLMRAASGPLQRLVPDRAMRSIVVARRR